MNTQDILSIAGSTQKHLETIQSKFFPVVKLALHPNVDGFKSPEAFGVYKGNGGEALSVMGKDFTPMQQQEFLDSIVNTVHNCGADLDLNTLEFHEYKGGRQISFSLQLESLAFKNTAGNYDETRNRILFSTSYDGSKSNTISLYTYRQICSNGMMGWGLDSVLKGKNTIGGKAKILSYCDEVMKIVAETQDYNARMKALDKIKVDKKTIEAFKLKLLGYNAETLGNSEKSETKKINILDRINESIGLEFSRTGETAYGLLNGISHYTNHVANNSKEISNDEFIRFHNGAKLNSTAQQLVFSML